MSSDVHERDVVADRLRILAEDLPQLMGWLRDAARWRGITARQLANEVGIYKRTAERILDGYNTTYAYWSTVVPLSRWLERQVRDGWCPPR